MALHDYFCSPCQRVLRDYNVAIAIGAAAGAPACTTCGSPMRWIPQVGRMDLRSDGDSESFRKFTTTDGRGNRVEIDSLATLRRVERESEVAFRNGEGQPMVWRQYAQDASNRDQHTLHRILDGGEHPTNEAKHRFGSSLQKSASEPDAAFGPGVTEQNASALPMSGGS